MFRRTLMRENRAVRKSKYKYMYDINISCSRIPGLLYNPFAQQMHSNESPTAISPGPVEGTGEQPLDLSAKPSSGSPSFSNDSKQIFRYVNCQFIHLSSSLKITNGQILSYHNYNLLNFNSDKNEFCPARCQNAADPACVELHYMRTLITINLINLKTYLNSFSFTQNEYE